MKKIISLLDLLFTFEIIFSCLLKIKFINCKIVLPVETLSEDNFLIKNNSLHQRIIQKTFYKSIYTILEIGSPIQKIPLFIN